MSDQDIDLNVIRSRMHSARNAKKVNPSSPHISVTIPGSELINVENADAANGTYLTTLQVCRMFGVTNMTIYNWKSKQRMPFIRVGATRRAPVRYDEGLLLKWAAETNKPIINDDYLEF